MFSKLKPQCHFKRKEATLTPTAECLIRFTLSIFIFNNFNQKERFFFWYLKSSKSETNTSVKEKLVG